MSRPFPIATIPLVMATSSGDGDGSPLGWLCTRMTLVAFSRFAQSPRPIDGQVFAVFVITMAAAEAAVALALAVAIYRYRETIDVDRLNVLKW